MWRYSWHLEKYFIIFKKTPVRPSFNRGRRMDLWLSAKFGKFGTYYPNSLSSFTKIWKVTPVNFLRKKFGISGIRPPLLNTKIPFLTSRWICCLRGVSVRFLFGFSIFFHNFQNTTPVKCKIWDFWKNRLDIVSMGRAIMGLHIKTMKIGGILWTRSLGEPGSRNRTSILLV